MRFEDIPFIRIEKDKYWSLKDIKSCYDITELDSEILCLKEEDDTLYYALFTYNSSVENDEELFKLVFHGWGSTGLREMRHTYFTEYHFYLPGKSIIKSLTILQQYFDMD